MRPPAEAASGSDTQRDQCCPLKTRQKISPEEILVRKVPDIRYGFRDTTHSRRDVSSRLLGHMAQHISTVNATIDPHGVPSSY